MLLAEVKRGAFVTGEWVFVMVMMIHVMLVVVVNLFVLPVAFIVVWFVISSHYQLNYI